MAQITRTPTACVIISAGTDASLTASPDFPTALAAEDGNFVTYNFPGGLGPKIRCFFDLSAIRPGATINGMIVATRQQRSGGTNRTAAPSARFANDGVTDGSHSISDEIGTGKIGNTTPFATIGIVTQSYGSALDHWGLTLTPELVTSASFCLDYWINGNATGASTPGQADIDLLTLTIDYRPPPGDASVTITESPDLVAITATIDIVASVNVTEAGDLLASAVGGPGASLAVTGKDDALASQAYGRPVPDAGQIATLTEPGSNRVTIAEEGSPRAPIAETGSNRVQV